MSSARASLVARAVVLDIEGTLSSTSFVVQRLYPYSAQRFRWWLEHRATHPDVVRIRAQLDDDAGRALDITEATSLLHERLADDVKSTPLKTLQGLIWADGFDSGELTSHFYPDVIPRLRHWRALDLPLYVFSSGSRTAQDAWFGHTPEGDLRSLFAGHYDTENAGAKRVASSYRWIADDIGLEAGCLAFLSDLPAELDAAREAGWQTVVVQREGEPYANVPSGPHPSVSSLNAVEIGSPT